MKTMGMTTGGRKRREGKTDTEMRRGKKRRRRRVGVEEKEGFGRGSGK
jgi:hypothetical protein